MQATHTPAQCEATDPLREAVERLSGRLFGVLYREFDRREAEGGFILGPGFEGMLRAIREFGLLAVAVDPESFSASSA